MRAAKSLNFFFQDTDSIFISVTNSGSMPEDFEKDFYQTWSAAFTNIVKPEKLASWNELSPKYFVLDQNPESKRKPGNNSFQIPIFD